MRMVQADTRRQPLTSGQVVERRQQLAPGQITGDAENDERRRARRRLETEAVL